MTDESVRSEFVRSGRVRFWADLEPLLVDIDSIQPHPENYNNGDVDEVMSSILRFGMYQPGKVQQSTGYVVAGNTSWAACKELGSSLFPAVVQDLDDEAAFGVMVEDNKIPSLAVPDIGRLLPILDRIGDTELGLLGTGWSAQEVAVLKAVEEKPLDIQTGPYEGWPTFAVTLDPRVLADFMEMTDDCDSNRERFEWLMRKGGWDG